MSKTLSDAETLQLINLVRQFPCIWDNHRTDYFNRELANEAFDAIAKEMSVGMTGEEVRRKFKSLRTQYTTRLHAISVKGSILGPNWKYFESLQFLRHCVTQRKKYFEPELPTSSSSSVSYQQPRPLRVVKVSGSPTPEEQQQQQQGGSSADEGEPMTTLILTCTPSSTTTTTSSFSASPGPLAAWNRKRKLSSTTPGEPAVLIPTLETVAGSVSAAPWKERRSDASSAPAGSNPVMPPVFRLQPVVGERSENDIFFEMLAKKVSRLPEDAQDRLRLEYHSMVVQELLLHK